MVIDRFPFVRPNYGTTYHTAYENHPLIVIFKKHLKTHIFNIFVNCSSLHFLIGNQFVSASFLLRKARKTNKDEDWVNYRRTRNKVTNKIWSAKSLYSRKLIEENSGDPKVFWKPLKKILPGDCKTASAPIMKVNGTNCTDKEITANSFNKYFTGVVLRLYEAIGFDVQNLSPTSASSQHHSTHSFKFERVSENDVKRNLRNLKTGKTSGLDDIPARLLKESSDIVASPL